MVFPGLLLIMSIFGVIFVVVLAVYHLKIIWLGQTTNENLKNVYKRSKNSFNKGLI